MSIFKITLTKGIVTYEVEANTEEEALCICDEMYNERKLYTIYLEERENKEE